MKTVTVCILKMATLMTLIHLPFFQAKYVIISPEVSNQTMNVQSAISIEESTLSLSWTLGDFHVLKLEIPSCSVLQNWWLCSLSRIIWSSFFLACLIQGTSLGMMQANSQIEIHHLVVCKPQFMSIHPL